MNLKFYKEMLEEHSNNEESLDFHTKESIINLYRHLLELSISLMEEYEFLKMVHENITNPSNYS